MKEIKYRVKDRKGNWYTIDTEITDGVETLPGTLCKATGVKDATGKDIFENDILAVQNLGDKTQPTLKVIHYVDYLLGFGICDAEDLKHGNPFWEQIDKNTLEGMLVVGNIIDSYTAADPAPEEMTKDIYKLTTSISVHHEPFRHVELYFDQESQALKVADRFKEHYDKIGFDISVNIEKVTLFLNANGYHGV